MRIHILTAMPGATLPDAAKVSDVGTYDPIQ